MVGLHSGTHSRSTVIGGIITIALADAFSDALGIHVSEESKQSSTPREVWESTVSTFLAKSIFAGSFVIPVIYLPISTAMIVSIAWGLLLLGVYSFHIAREQNVKTSHVVGEHLLIAVIVITLTHLLGDWIRLKFG